MTPWELVDIAAVPGEIVPLRLMRRGHEFIIWLGPIALMGSRAGQSEEVLAELGCAGLGAVANSRVLIGGLGMGFTLRAALRLLGPEAAVTVAELVPAVVAWGRGPLSTVHAGSLDDPRVAIHDGDVGRLIARAAAGAAPAARYDAILLDVDNGPDGLTHQGNDALYEARGLRSAWEALRPGGTLAVWSSKPDERFTARLRRAGFAVDVATPRAHGKRGIRHVVWVAKATSETCPSLVDQAGRRAAMNRRGRSAVGTGQGRQVTRRHETSASGSTPHHERRKRLPRPNRDPCLHGSAQA